MARFGRMFALGSGDGKTVPTKTSPSSLQKLWRTLSAEKKRVPLRFFTYSVKSTRVLFKEIELWERCKTTVICGMKSMTNTANVENAGSINNPPGWLSSGFLGGPISGKAILEIQIMQLSFTSIQYTQELGLKSFAHLSLTDLCPGRFLLRATEDALSHLWVIKFPGSAQNAPKMEVF